MKTALFISSFFILATFASAQKVSETAVPETVKTTFRNLYKNVKSEKWIAEKNNYEVEFTVSGSEMSLLIDPLGKLLETETEMPVNALPQSVRDACAKNFHGKKIKEAATIVSADGTSKYEANIEGKNYFFDANGNQVN